MPRRSAECHRLLAGLIAVVAAAVYTSPAEAEVGIGGRLFATGGTVEIVVQPATAAYTSQLFLLQPDGTRTKVALNTEVGRQVTIGPFPMGQELVFGITLSPDQSFFMGPASRNPDGIAHASVTEIGERTFLVGFEDQFGGGDRDYDDTVFQFTGNLAPSTGDPAPSLDPLPVQDPSSPTPDAQADVSALTLEEARRRLRRVLRENYGRRYTRRQGRLAKSCSRLSSVKVRCRVRWKTRRHRYWGRVTLWVDEARPGSMLFTTSIRRTPRGLAARR